MLESGGIEWLSTCCWTQLCGQALNQSGWLQSASSPFTEYTEQFSWITVFCLQSLCTLCSLCLEYSPPGIQRAHPAPQITFMRPFFLNLFYWNSVDWGFPGGASGKGIACQCRRCRRFWRLQFNPWVGKIPWRRAWHPTPVFLPGESHGQRSLAGYSPQGHQE